MHFKKIRICFIILFAVQNSFGFGQNYLLQKDKDVLEYVKMIIYNDLLYNSTVSISLDDYNCLIKNSSRIFSFDTLESVIKGPEFIRVKFPSEETLQLEYFKEKDCYFEIAHILYLSEKGILFPTNSYLVATWGRVYKLASFLKDDTDSLIDDLVDIEVNDMIHENFTMCEKKREKMIIKFIKKRRKELQDEVKILISQN